MMAKALFEKIADSGVRLRSPSYAVNIGCNDGIAANDPVYPLYQMGFSGLAIDGQSHKSLKDNLGQFPVVLRTNTYVFPTNVISIFQEAGAPPNMEFLKIDVDGCDGPILDAILKGGVRPLVIQVEVNSEIPPPIAFSVCPHPKYVPIGRTGFFGCSLGYVCDLVSTYDYALVDLDFETQWTHDALFVHRSMLSWGLGIAELNPREAFLSQPPLLPHLDCVSREIRLNWRTKTNYSQLRDEIWCALTNANELKHGHQEVPFELYITPPY
jgi:hypothetical protein